MSDAAIGTGMPAQTQAAAGLLGDEIVCYLADRYRTTPRGVVSAFRSQVSGAVSEPFHLEDNEMEMMRGLVEMYDAKH